ncbi:MAG: type II toxin-antitoxin system PemK/MazF family toxin [Bacteroidota bacterium]
MIIHQKDIVEIAFYTGRKPEAHPAVIISNDEIFESEGFFYAVLLSTKNIFPEYTLEITPDMINKPKNDRTGYAVCHMLQQFYPEDIIGRTGATLKQIAFDKVVEKIKQVVF